MVRLVTRSVLVLGVSALVAGSMSAQGLGSVVAVVTGADGSRVPFAVVTADARSRFTDDGGRVRLDSLRSGTVRMRVEHSGFLPATVGASVRGGVPDTIHVTLTRFRPRWTALKPSAEPRCGGGPGAPKDSIADAVIEQARIGVRVNNTLAREYPFQYLLAREISESMRGSAADTNMFFGARDSVISGSARYWRYTVGSIEAAMDPDSLEERSWLSPIVTLADLGDRSFEEAHCFLYRGVESVRGRRLVRVDIEPLKRVKEPDVHGKIYLDSATWAVRRLHVYAYRDEHWNGVENERFDSLFVESTYREIVPSVPVIDSAQTTRRLAYRGVNNGLGPGSFAYEQTRHREHVVALTQVGGSALYPSPLHRLAAHADSAAARFSGYAVAIYSDSIRAAVHGFVNRWRTAWERSEGERHKLSDIEFRSTPMAGLAVRNDEQRRRSAVVCNINSSDPGSWNPFRDHAIQSGAGKRAICPTWQIDASTYGEEAVDIDAGISRKYLGDIVRARDSLLWALAQASRRRPTDGWVSGQRVRFAVDQKNWGEAAVAVAACAAERWWCLELEGFVRHSRGDEGGADVAFTRALDAMPAPVRCEWTDFSPLLSWRDVNEYKGISCAARQEINERLWWMSDPLWSDTGNDRRSEQYSRMVLARLRADGPLAERWETRPRYGGVAFSEMISRYGWPTMSWWAGPGTDQVHYEYLSVTSQRRRRLGIFTTAEYSVDRPHTVPMLSAIQDPIHSRPSDWFLAPPRESLTGAPTGSWWPVEHYRRERGMLFQLFEQTATFRRQDGALVAVSTQPHPQDMGVRAGDTVEARFIIAATPDSMEVIKGRAIAGRAAVLQTTVKPRSGYVIGFEVFRKDPDSSGAAARTRYGITPPPPLSAMKPGEIAIAAPAFVRPPVGTELPTTDPRAALSRMYPNATFAGAGRVGFYFETYGIRESDSASMAILVYRRGKDSVTLGWQEPSSQYGVTTMPGAVPIQSRNITFDLTGYEPGDYVVQVRATLHGVTVTAERDLTIAAPGAALYQYRFEEAPLGRGETQWVEALVAAANEMHPPPDYAYGTRSETDELTRIVMKRLGVTTIGEAHLSMRVLNPTTDRLTVLAILTIPMSKITTVGCFDIRPNKDGNWAIFYQKIQIEHPESPVVSKSCLRMSEWY